MRLLSIISSLVVATAVVAAPPAIPDTPASVNEVLYARPFQLDKGYHTTWGKDRPIVTSGYILALRVNPDLVYPRQVAEPVLYVGNQIAERVNIGYESGVVIAIVPGKIAGKDRLDLTKAPIWFGTPELPERIDQAAIDAERKMADRAGIQPIAGARVRSALTRGGGILHLQDDRALYAQIAPIVAEYSGEIDLAETLIPDN